MVLYIYTFYPHPKIGNCSALVCSPMLCLQTTSCSTSPFSVFRVVIIFIIIKILFYVCWYRSRQRQLAAYLSNPRNAQIVIVGGRAYLHQVCERQSVSVERDYYYTFT